MNKNSIKMHIGYDAKRLFHNHTGLGNYSRNLIQNLRLHQPQIEITLFSPKANKSSFTKNYNQENIHISEISPPLANLKRMFGYVRLVDDSKINLFHGLSNEIPAKISKTKIPSIVTIHDLIYKTFPHDFSLLDRNIYAYKTKKACEQADHIIAISEATRKDLIKLLDVPKTKISVLYQSCHPSFENQEKKKSELTKKLPNEYMLYVGSINKRKNLLGIVKAMHAQPKDIRIPLVVVGSETKSPYRNEIDEYIQKYNLANEIFFLGRLNNSELKALYQKARFFVFPSFYEGFGIPIIESLFSGTPVITSINSSLPEAAGPCGLFVDPNKQEQLADDVRRMTEDDQLLNKLTSKIPQHIEKFTGKKTATKLVELYSRYI